MFRHDNADKRRREMFKAEIDIVAEGWQAVSPFEDGVNP